MTSSKELAADLYAALAAADPQWKVNFQTIDAAAEAAGPEAVALLAAYRANLTKRTKRELHAADALKSREEETEADSDGAGPVFDRGAVGRYNLAERRDEPGREQSLPDSDTNKEEEQQRTVSPGRVEDPLWHPDRQVPTGEWSTKAYSWNHVPPARPKVP
jgi:hypothetical protein